jgi:lysozyme
MDNKCIFVDVSLWQPNMDWVQLSQNGVTGAIIKASSGSYRKDPLFTRHVQGVADSGLMIGAYHWCDPTNDDLAQAKNFLSAIKGFPVRFLAIDMEQFWQVWAEFYARDIETIVPGWRISQNAYRVASYLKKNSGLPVIVYTRASFVSYRTPEAAEWLPQFPLWLAYYPYSRVRVTTTWSELKEKYLPVVKGPLLPENCTSWVFWQFSGDKFRLDGTGGSAIDLNFFNGDVKELSEFIQSGLPPTGAVDPSVPRKAKTLYRLNLRSEPRVAYETLIGKLERGTVVDVLEIKQIGMDKWARIGENRWAAMEYRNAFLMVWL